MTRLADADARELARREFAVPVALEAGAGTGKTRALVSRIGTWLLGPGWTAAAAELGEERSSRGAAPPTAEEIATRACEGVVAITFTEAAAAEMASRVEGLLAQALADPATIDDLEELPEGVSRDDAAQRAERLLAASARLRISTIHGFCHRLLAESPLEAGLHPAFEVDADGEQTAALATEVLLVRLRSRDAALVELLADGVDPPELLAALQLLASQGVTAEELRRDPFSSDVLRIRFAELGRALDALLAEAAPLRSGHRVRSILDGLAALDRLRAALGEATPTPAGLTTLREELERARSEARKILAGWGSGAFGKTEQKLLGGVPPALATAAARTAELHGALAELDPARLAAARRALVEPLAELVARRRAQGIVSFDDLLARAAKLLGERRGVRDRVRRGIRQLLVDEFQDTDRRQCDLLRRLVLDDSPAPRPGLLVVGDPKQSIYGWRSADLAAYDGLLHELEAAGGVIRRLEINFRSAPPVLAEVERALAPVLVAEPGIQAAFQPLRPSPKRASDTGFTSAGRAPVEYWASWERDALAGGGKTSAADAGGIEARAIAADVRELVDSGTARWRDFALLLRARGDLDVFLDALRRADVPYVVQKDRSYYRRREVIDAVAAVRAILDPEDLLALVAYLRSPFVGVPDAAWLPLWRAGFPAAMIALDGDRGLAEALVSVRQAAAEPIADPRLRALTADWADSLTAAVEAVARLRAEFRTLPASAWVERLRSRLLIEPIAASRFLGRFGLANLERLFAELEASLLDAPDPGHALVALRRAIAEETPAEEARPPEQDDDAVAVMTIHTAKGLEFPHVYLAQAQRQAGGPAARALPWLAVGPLEEPREEPQEEPREMVLFGAPTPGWREVEARRRRVAAAEVARLLYVAATRAKDRLVVCGRWRPDEAGAETPSFADLLAPRIAAAPLPTLEDPVRRDEHGVLWRLADSGTGETVAKPRSAANAPDETGAAAVTAPRRIAARHRTGRPRLLAASRLAETAIAATAPLDSEPVGGPIARVLGVALHRALELAPLAKADDSAWRDAARTSLASERTDTGGDPASALDAALERLESSLLWKRLQALEPLVRARELPLVAAVEAARIGDANAPTDGYVGTVDLLYEDPESGDLVVADFKSDALEEDDVAAKVEQYRPQLELYARAVRVALGLTAPPRLELWLLALDRVVEVPASRAGGDSE